MNANLEKRTLVQPAPSRATAGLLRFVVALTLLVTLNGCQRLDAQYGKSKSAAGKKSLNGFGALRRVFELNDYKTREVTRLTDRVRRTDVIVWTPNELGPIDAEATHWFEGWFETGGKTLIYIIPDSGSEAEYWQQAITLAPPNTRLEYRKRIAKAINQRIQWRTNRSTPPSNGWFDISPSITAPKVGPTFGDWNPTESPTDSLAETRMEVAINAHQAPTPSPTSNANTTTTFIGGYAGDGTTGPSSAGYVFNTEVAPTSATVQFEPKLIASDESVLMGEVRSDSWNDSRVIVVGGGSMLTNFAFSKPHTHELASKIVASASAASNKASPKVGFLNTGPEGVPVSEQKTGVPIASGMELLTVWPISLVTLHGVLLGLIVYLMLWPIFGTSRGLNEPVHNDFGDHLDAIATLMQKADDDGFARARISEYQRRIRGESDSPWAISPSPSPPPATPTTPPPPKAST